MKEIEAARFSLKALMMDRDVVNLHMDSHAVAFVNRMGGTRLQISVWHC